MDIRLNDILSEEDIKKSVKNSLEKIDFAKKTFIDTFPSHASVNNVYTEDENIGGWNEGFWTGMLWIAYELTRKDEYKSAALHQIPSYMKRITEKLGVDHHDMGFLYTPSCVAAYKLTGDEEAKKAAILAADNLLKRYHEKGEFLQAWGEYGAKENYRLIIDCLLNIPLLYWASEVTGDKKYDEIAYKHFCTTIANIMRPDGSTYHTFFFNPETGAPEKGVTAQGATDDSCWARGQAWGVYGTMLTQAYHPNDMAIEKFKKISDYFLAHLPKDSIPYWDMSFTDGSDEPRDSSAAAIAICGLLEGCKFLPDDDTDKERYLKAANSMMKSLIDGYMTDTDPESNGLLLHAVYSKPGNNGVDECNIWGDYFFMEAIIRFVTNNEWKLYW